MESWFISDEFIHDACFDDGLKGWFRWFVLFFSFIDNNDIKILQKLSLLLLLHLWWMQNCRQQKVYNRLCTKSVLYIFWNKARRPRQALGSSCCLQDMCRTFERQWTSGTRQSMGFSIPMVWREPKNHVGDCYLCSINMTGVNKKKRKSLSYKKFFVSNSTNSS